MPSEIENNFSESNQQVLSGILQLQKTEKELYANLAMPNLSSNEKKRIIDQINELSQMRIDMYSNLRNLYSSYQSNVNNLDVALNTQIQSVDYMEDELNQVKVKLNAIDQMKVDKLRTVEINNYYAKRYNAYKNIMFVISISCIPILLLTILNNNTVIPSNIYGVLVSLIAVIASYFIFKQYLDISNRDNINWDSYSWYFNKSDAPKQGENSSESSDTNNEDENNENETEPCVGSSCCQIGTVYDANLNICIPID
jgi:hypothetical protein